MAYNKICDRICAILNMLETSNLSGNAKEMLNKKLDQLFMQVAP